MLNDAYQAFHAGITALQNCTWGVCYPHISLPWENYQKMACIYAESVPSKATCVREAEGKLRELYEKAAQGFSRYAEPCSPESFLSTFQVGLSDKIHALQALLTRCRSRNNAAIANRLALLLTTDRVFAEMARWNDVLRNRYMLPSPMSYLSLIVYDVSDPSDFEEGAMKLIAKAFRRHGYDLLPALHQLERDASRLLSEYQKAFDVQAKLMLRTYITTPIQAKLPLLRETTGGINNV